MRSKLSYSLQNVSEENKYSAEVLLKESFAKQDNGTFDQEYMKLFIPRMISLIKPEKVEQVKQIMMNHKVWFYDCL